MANKLNTLNKTNRWNYITYLLVIIAYVILQVMSSTGSISSSLKGMLVPICAYVVMAVSLNLTVGVLGELSLGHAGFMSVGAFTGVTAAVAEALKEAGVQAEDFQLHCTACSGIDACKTALFKLERGIGDINFIEGMACEGGCVQGAGIVIRSPKNQAEVGKHVKAAGERTIHAAVEAAP